MKTYFYLILATILITGCSKEVSRETSPGSPSGPSGSPGSPSGPSGSPGSPSGPSGIPNETVLNGPLTSGGDVLEQYQTTPDGKYVIYIADETTNGDNELYIVNSDGTNKRKLQAVPSGRDVIHFVISPDSTRVAFLMDLTTQGMYDLYTINIDQTGLTKLNSGITSSSRSVSKTYKFTPDSSKVVFVTNENTGLRDLFIANAVAPINRTQLNTPAKTPVSSVFDITPNGSRIVYKESSDSAHPNIRSVLPTATGDVQLNPNFVLPASGASDFVISPTSSKVVYRANQDNDAIYELYSVNTDGTGSVTKVNGPIVTGGSVNPLSFKVTSSGSKVLYIADQLVDEKFELFASNIDGSGNVKISGPLPSSSDVSDFKLTGDNLKAVYRANGNTSNVQELYSVNLTGLGFNQINSILVSGENVGEYQIVGSSKVVYAMDKGSVGVYSIYSANLDGSAETKLNPAITTGVGFYDPAQSSLTGTRQIGLSNDNSRVVMVGSLQGSPLDIFSVALDSSNFKKVNAQSSGSIVLNSTLDGSGFLTLPTLPYAVYRYNNGFKTQLYVGLIKD